MLEINPTAKVSHLADIEPSTRGTRIVLGARTQIDSFVKIKPAGGMADVRIGEDCYINSGTVIYSGNGITIGDNVLIAANCTLAPTNHAFTDRTMLIRQQGFAISKGGIVIEDDVWVGAGSTILDGSILRKGCVIAANSVVRGQVDEYCIVGGNPPRLIGMRR